MNARAAVTEVNDAFYRAFESLDLARMESVWLREPWIGCIHPGWTLLVGWGPVMESWERIFGATLAMRFTLSDVHVEVRGDVAWVTLTENLESHHRDGKVIARVQATNLFQQRDGRWYLVHHHGSPVHMPDPDVPPSQLH